jgi:deoxyhypusine synthase
MNQKSQYLKGKRIDPVAIHPDLKIPDLVDHVFCAYNAARLREACHLYAKQMLDDGVTVGLTLSGALSPAGMGISTFIPLIDSGFVDWIVTMGANLYHDTHFGIGLEMHVGNPQTSDVVLREEGVVRIYDIFFDYHVLLSTDAFLREVISAPEFQKEMSTAEFHHRIGRYVNEREKVLGLKSKSVLAAAYRCGVPVYTSSPGDSSIGMNVAAKALDGNQLRLDVCADVNETAAIVLEAKRAGGKSAVFICGGGSPKNFILQTEPQLQEVLYWLKGHDTCRHGCKARHGRFVRCDTQRSRELGQGGSGTTAGYGGLLLRFHHCSAIDRGVCDCHSKATKRKRPTTGV